MLPKTAKDIAGQKFGRLTAVSYAGVGPDKRGSLWNCICECGTPRTFIAGDLRRGQNVSCGCLNRDTQRKRMTTHGRSRTHEYRIWNSMKMRCTNPSDDGYHNYGSRGITICQRWLDSFENFLADMGEAPTKLELDRIDNNGPYSPENCRWATRSEQCRNTRQNRLFTFDGVTKCATDWAEPFGMSGNAFAYRVSHGWSFERATTTPVRTVPFRKRRPRKLAT